MNIKYEFISEEKAELCRELCNELMVFQKSVAKIRTELSDPMCFETRMIPSIESSIHNYIVLAKDDDKPVGYVYSNISPKEAYSNDFATFFSLSSIKRENVGCLSQFYIREDYRKMRIGSVLFDMSMDWLNRFENVDDYFVFVSNGNDNALEFYERKGFVYSHKIMDGFISVLRNKK